MIPDNTWKHTDDYFSLNFHVQSSYCSFIFFIHDHNMNKSKYMKDVFDKKRLLIYKDQTLWKVTLLMRHGSISIC